jgi:hypothetical protein
MTTCMFCGFADYMDESLSWIQCSYCEDEYILCSEDCRIVHEHEHYISEDDFEDEDHEDDN